VEINSAWEMIRENIKMSAKESVGCYEFQMHKPWLDNDAQNYYIKGNKLNCSGYKTQVEEWG
jgi:hypothetical protein